MPQESINLRGIPLAWYIFFCQKIYTKERSRYTMKFLKIVEEIQIMVKNRWIDENKFKIAMTLISEIGKLVGGLIKYYAKKNKK